MGNGQFGHGRWSRPLVKAVWSPSECSISVALPANAARAGCQPLRWLRTRKVASHLLLHVLKLFSKITLVPTSCCMVAKITRIPIGGDKSRLFPSIVACSPKLRLLPPSVACSTKLRLFPPSVVCSSKPQLFPPSAACSPKSAC